VAFAGEEDVLRLQVAIYDISAVKVLQGTHELGDVIAYLVFPENLPFLKVIEEFPSTAVVTHQEEFACRLKSKPE